MIGEYRRRGKSSSCRTWRLQLRKVKAPQGELRAIGFGQVGEHGKGIQLL
jgi:hypothetical protein